MIASGPLKLVAIPIALVIRSIGVVSVFKAIYVDRRDLKCACVGDDSKVPLGFISLTENFVMVAIWPCGWRFGNRHGRPKGDQNPRGRFFVICPGSAISSSSATGKSEMADTASVAYKIALVTAAPCPRSRFRLPQVEKLTERQRCPMCRICASGRCAKGSRDLHASVFRRSRPDRQLKKELPQDD